MSPLRAAVVALVIGCVPQQEPAHGYRTPGGTVAFVLNVHPMGGTELKECGHTIDGQAAKDFWPPGEHRIEVAMCASDGKRIVRGMYVAVGDLCRTEITAKPIQTGEGLGIDLVERVSCKRPNAAIPLARALPEQPAVSDAAGVRGWMQACEESIADAERYLGNAVTLATEAKDILQVHCFSGAKKEMSGLRGAVRERRALAADSKAGDDDRLHHLEMARLACERRAHLLESASYCLGE